jgi:hypothetical protein
MHKKDQVFCNKRASVTVHTLIENNGKMLTFNRIFAKAMNRSVKISKNNLKHKLATALMICVSVACFATLGDGSKKKSTGKTLLTHKQSYNYKQFSLKSDYNYRGNNLLSTPAPTNMLVLNPVVTFQRGNTTYIMPMKKKVVLDKVKFNPASTPRY